VPDWGGWLTPHPGGFTPGNDSVLTVKEAGWAPEPVGMGAENLLLDRPGRSESPKLRVKLETNQLG
jgi:hypothetical protein